MFNGDLIVENSLTCSVTIIKDILMIENALTSSSR